MCYLYIPLYTSAAPFEIDVEYSFESRPKKHVDSVKKAVQYGYPSPLHYHGESVSYLDHEEEPNAVTARRQVVLEVLNA